MLAKIWLDNARGVMDKIERTQMENIRKAAETMADTIQAGRWVHTFGCGHATIPVEEMYPRIGGFVGFHPMIELPLTFFTNIVGGMSVHQFIFLERVEGYGIEIMKGYNFDRLIAWLFSARINAVNIDVAVRLWRISDCVRSPVRPKQTDRHSCGKPYLILPILVTLCTPAGSSVPLIDHVDGPVSPWGSSQPYG
jgi:uncharacterized phosphosugar-binding protein